MTLKNRDPDILDHLFQKMCSCRWTLPSLPPLNCFNLRSLRSHSERMMHLGASLFDMDWQGAVLLWVLPLTLPGEGDFPVTTNPPMRMKGYPLIPPFQIGPPHRRCGSRRSHSSWSGSDSDGTHSSGGRHKKKDGFLSKIQIPEFRGKKGHTHDVASAFWQWARCITYYRDYYEDSYLMPLVVSSLMGDASDVFDWI